MPEAVNVVTVCDREGARYEFFDRAVQTGRRFLVRIVQNRLTVEHQRLLDDIRKRPCAGRVEARIPRDSRRNLHERTAVVPVRYGRFEVKRPHARDANKALRESIPLHIIYAKEEEPGAGLEPIEWVAKRRFARRPMSR